MPPSKLRSISMASFAVERLSIAMYSVVMRPAAVFSWNPSSSLTSSRCSCSISPRISAEVSADRSPSKSAAASGSISSTMSAARSESSDSTIERCSFGVISSSASAATSSSSVSKTASRSAGASSSMMSAMSAGCSLARSSWLIFSFTRRAGSVSIRSTNSHGIMRGGIFLSSARNAGAGTNPRSSRRTAPRAPTSTDAMRSATCPSKGSSFRSTSLTRTTLRPWTSMICWSSRSRVSSSMPSEPTNGGHSDTAVRALIPPLIEAICPNPSRRSPLLVRTMSAETRVASSCGQNATSRTRPAMLPPGSCTGTLNSSVSAKFTACSLP